MFCVGDIVFKNNVIKDVNKINLRSEEANSHTVTRYIYIKNIEQPVKVFRETAV